MVIITGHVLYFVADPFNGTPQDAAKIIQDGAVYVHEGKIHDFGPRADIIQRFPTAPVQDYRDHLIMAGFVDAHVHYPQTAMIASWGKRLIDWLNTYTFPEESKFIDAAYADTIANRYLDLALAHGTTTVASFCTIHPDSVDAIFTAASARNM